MKLIRCLLLPLALLLSTAAQAGPIKIGVSQNYNNDLHNAATLAASYGAGSSATMLNVAAFNAMSTSQLLANYDMLALTWASPSTFNFDWATVLLPYLNAGGIIIWEDTGNRGDLYAGSGLSAGTPGTPGTYTGEFGANSFTSSHFAFTISGTWDCFYTSSADCLAAKNTIGGGAIIVSGPDEFYHDNTTGNDAYLRAQTDWLLANSNRVPEPGVLALFGFGLVGVSLAGRRRRSARQK